jgi:hypothetical protein
MVAETQEATAIMVKKSRNSNFSFSTSNRPTKMQTTTSASHAYTPEKLA